ncbi:hypothetical protein K504DRAFT_438784 [Pleomassaria siparia CBS 279.74]|uniref:Uncharacterized protein n=1 Tax=Pleomassaria siparia CBS 279.74 TaxID=1314801 RepID=A0A6G1K0S2_9PLEO|nr:hypothetical protein K504DRAFT_438784 [Pleomassaria siparia CBS 279.74]
MQITSESQDPTTVSEDINEEPRHAPAAHPTKKHAHDDTKDSAKLRAKVMGDQKRLKALLHQKQRQAEKQSATRRKEFANTLLTAFLPPGSKNDSTENLVYPSYPGTSIALNTVYVSAAEMINKSRGLVAEYDRLETMTAELGQENKESIIETWEKDVEDCRRVLDLGDRYATRQVKRMLNVYTATGDTEMKDGEEGEKDSAESYALINTLRYTERGVKRIAKGLPMECLDGEI